MTFNSAIGNYDYGFNWVFHQDGTLELEANLTGTMLVKASADTMHSKGNHFGRRVANNLLATNHQHFSPSA
jgi:primary-amine oxidase